MFVPVTYTPAAPVLPLIAVQAPAAGPQANAIESTTATGGSPSSPGAATGASAGPSTGASAVLSGGVSAPAGLAGLGPAPTPIPSTAAARTTIVVRRRARKARRLALSRSSSTRAFVQCVTMRESSMRWHIVDPPYSGGDQWTASAWIAAGGGRFAAIAAQATPEQQIWVFEQYEPSHPDAWPVTVPACS